jgi:replicative DNA helicase Mcm
MTNQEIIAKFEQFYRTYYHDEIGELAGAYPHDKESIHVNWMDLFRYDNDLADDLIDQPEVIQEYAEEALRLYDLPVDVGLGDAHVRFYNVDDTKHITAIDADRDVSTLQAVKGQVNKMSENLGKDQEVAFECQRCGTLTRVAQAGDGRQEPHECQACERKGPFQEKADESESQRYRRIRIQLPPEVARGDTDTSMNVHLYDDLAEMQLDVGDSVIVNGIIRKEYQEEDSNVFKPAADAVDVERVETDYEQMDVEEHLDEIRAIADGEYGTPLEVFANSIAPGIHGYDDVKKAIALQLMGGVEKELPDGGIIRGNIHVLEMGDPSTGKSQRMKHATKLSPRSVESAGKNSSGAGLTCAAVQDDWGGNGWTLEGGAVVEAHKGLLAIDELDKMEDDDRSGIMKAMSEMEVPVSKAGINATLPANTSILAAANPRGDRFDRYTPLGEQFDLSPALMSRFDLIFTAVDRPDRDDDSEIADQLNRVALAGQMLAAGEELPEHLEGDVSADIESDVLQSFVAYVREQANNGRGLNPIFSEDAMETIKNAYVNFRQVNGDFSEDESDDDPPVPITARDITSIHRLAEAVARMELSDTIEQTHAEQALTIVRESLEEVGIDPETGQFDADRVETGSSKTQSERVKAVKKAIKELESADAVSEDELVSELQSEYDRTKVLGAVQSLLDKGLIYEPQTDHYRPS